MNSDGRAGRRRLLQTSSIKVTTVLQAVAADSVKTVASALTAERINFQLQKQSMPQAQVCVCVCVCVRACARGADVRACAWVVKTWRYHKLTTCNAAADCGAHVL